MNHSHPLASQLIDNFYVDNFARCYDSLSKMEAEYSDICNILSDANMPLQGWISNSIEFNESIKSDTSNPIVNVLGLDWDIDKDVLSVKSSKMINQYASDSDDCILTKRKAVAAVASVFDPLGFANPLYIQAKVYIQKLWRMKLEWDEPLIESLRKEFLTLCRNMTQIPDLKFPRFVIKPKKCELHLFCDASKSAYGFVAYSVNTESNTSLFLLSKARVAPTETLTIPKLELTSIYFACNFAELLMNNSSFAFARLTCWSDSKVALCWILNNKSKDVYVSNRVKKIKNLQCTFKYIPTDNNPADLLSRGVSYKNLCSSKLWLHGPSFLNNPTEWSPHFDFENIAMNELLVEPQVVDAFEPCLNMSKYHSLQKSIEVMQFVIEFLQSFACTKDRFKDLQPYLVLARLAQQEHYPTTYNYLKTADSTTVPRDVINFCNQLGLYIDKHDLIRCSGRLDNSVLPMSTKNPILLPPKSTFAQRLIKYFHEIHRHAGVNTLLSLIREEYWLPQGRRQIKTVIKQCILCQKLWKRPLSLPSVPSLPDERVNFEKPFQAIGVDLTGAYDVFEVDLDTSETIRGKAYICLFTCAATRAVHLELLQSLSTLDFLFAFRRFCASYSVPKVIISDHGSNFKGCDNFLKQIAQEPEVVSHLKNLQIKWKYITAHSPWQGGFYERLIGVVKRALSSAVCKRKLSFIELQTLLCEVKAVVNSRPLTYISENLDDDYLTPNLLLYGRNILLAPPLDEFDENSVPYQDDSQLRSYYTKLSSALKCFQESWVKNYLTSLRERHYGNNPKREEKCPVEIGDIVVVDLEGHRNLWPLGKVTKLYPGKDGKVRSVQVFIKGKLLDKPLSKLVHLELEKGSSLRPDVAESGLDANITPQQIYEARPMREAAKRAASARRELVLQGCL